jgi:hypothetical protein
MDQFSLASLSPHLRELATLELANQQPAAKVATVSELSLGGNTALAKALGSLSDFSPSAFMATASSTTTVGELDDEVGLSKNEIMATIVFLNQSLEQADLIILEDVLSAILLLDSREVSHPLLSTHVKALGRLAAGLSSQLNILCALLHSRKCDLELAQKAYVVCTVPFSTEGSDQHHLTSTCVRLAEEYVAAVQRKIRVEFSITLFDHARAVACCGSPDMASAPCSIDSLLGPAKPSTKRADTRKVFHTVGSATSSAAPPARVRQPEGKAVVSTSLKSNVVLTQNSVVSASIKDNQTPRVNRFDRSCKTNARHNFVYDPSINYGGSASALHPIPNHHPDDNEGTPLSDDLLQSPGREVLLNQNSPPVDLTESSTDSSTSSVSSIASLDSTPSSSPLAAVLSLPFSVTNS